jgi:hypothetical protein
LRGALPPVDLRAVCLVRAMVDKLINSKEIMLGIWRPTSRVPLYGPPKYWSQIPFGLRLALQVGWKIQ